MFTLQRGAVTMMRSSSFDTFFNTPIVGLARVVLEGDGEPLHLSDTLVFTLDNSRTFELVKEDETVLLKEILSVEDLVATFAVEADETLRYQLLDAACGQWPFTLPFTIVSVTEVRRQVQSDSPPYLAALIFWDGYQKPVLALCTAGDEIEIETIERLEQRIGMMALPYGTLEAREYRTDTVPVSL